MCKFLQYMHCWSTWTVNAYPESDVMVSWCTSYLHTTARTTVNDEKNMYRLFTCATTDISHKPCKKQTAANHVLKVTQTTGSAHQLLHYLCRIARYNAANSSANGINVYSQAQRNHISSVWHSRRDNRCARYHPAHFPVLQSVYICHNHASNITDYHVDLLLVRSALLQHISSMKLYLT